LNYKFALMLLLLCLCVSSQAKDNNCEVLNDVSIISLIATPDKYNGLCVRAKGVLFLDDRSGRLFFDKESLSNNVLANSVLIVISSDKIAKIKKMDSSYVSISGIFVNQAIAQVFDMSIF
jgi:hypothetical protein